MADKSLLHKMHKRAFDSVFGRDPRDHVADPSNEIYQLLEKAHLDFGSRRTAEARQSCERALFLSRRYGNLLGEAFSLRQLSPIYSAMGRYDQSKKCAVRALEIARQTGEPDPALQSDALISIGVACREMGQLEEALHHLQEAMNLLDELRVDLFDDEDISAWNADRSTIWGAIGRVRLYQSDYEGAFTALDQSLEISTKANNRRGTIEWSLDQTFAYLYLLNREREKAMEMLQFHLGRDKQEIDGIDMVNMLHGLDQRLRTYEDNDKHFYFIYNIMRAIIAAFLGETDKTYKAISMEYFENAWGQLEQARSGLIGHGPRISFIGVWTVIFRSAVALSVQLKFYIRAFAWVERVRSRTFTDWLGIIDESKSPTNSAFLENRWTVNPISYQELKTLLAV